MMPKPKIVIWFNREALNTATWSNKLPSPPLLELKNLVMAPGSTIGNGMCQPTRYTASKPSVKRIFFRSSGIVKTTRIFSHILDPSLQETHEGRHHPWHPPKMVG